MELSKASREDLVGRREETELWMRIRSPLYKDESPVSREGNMTWLGDV